MALAYAESVTEQPTKTPHTTEAWEIESRLRDQPLRQSSVFDQPNKGIVLYVTERIVHSVPSTPITNT